MQTNPLGDASAPRALTRLEHLSDSELLAGTRRLVGRSNQLLAELLVHLGEVEARGIHRTRACSSLYTYCIYELRFSEDEAFRRVAAARLVRRFPALLDALASGELHLTGLLMLGPHLTKENLADVLARAKYRTKRELARLVRILDPLPAVPARIEPLGPAPARLVPPEPTWQAFVDSTCPIRELAPGDRPRDWIERTNDCGASSPEQGCNTGDASESPSEGQSGSQNRGQSADDTARDDGDERTTMPAPERADLRPLERLEPERYKVQFTATEEYVRLVDEARALLSHTVPNVTLEELHLRAMHALVMELKKKKYAIAGSSPARAREAETGDAPARAPDSETADPLPGPASRIRREHPAALAQGAKQSGTDALEQHAQPDDALDQGAQQLRGRPELMDAPEHAEQPRTRRRGRHIPAAVRRSVFERVGSRCSYLEAGGTRCPETHRLEFHHLKPFATGGDHVPLNLTLRCAAHNALAAEKDFGRELIEDRKNSLLHDSLRSHSG